jgi:hypothetical protein
LTSQRKGLFKAWSTYSSNTSVRQGNVDGHAGPELTTEPSNAGEQTTEDDTSDPQLCSSSNHVVGRGTTDSKGAGNDRIGEGQKQSSICRGNA